MCIIEAHIKTVAGKLCLKRHEPFSVTQEGKRLSDYAFLQRMHAWLTTTVVLTSAVATNTVSM